MLAHRLLLSLLVLSLVLGVAPSTATAQRPQRGDQAERGRADKQDDKKDESKDENEDGDQQGKKDGNRFEVDGYIRVIDGQSIEAWVDGKRTAIGLIGVDAPPGNTPCGRDAADRLRDLLKGGMQLEEDPDFELDERLRRMYHVKAKDGRKVADELLKAGLAKADRKGTGRERALGLKDKDDEAKRAVEPELEAAEDAARAAGRGCVWGGRSADADGATVAVEGQEHDAPATGAGTDSASAPAAASDPTEPALQSILAAPLALPSGFTEDAVATVVGGPTNFAFLPDGRILVTTQSGRVRVIKDGVLLGTDMLNIEDWVNDHWDHGLLGIAVDPNFPTNPYIYLLYTFENGGAYEGPKTGRVDRFTVTGDTASRASRTPLLGTVNGAGCTNPAADCIPSEGLSHSVGSLKFAHDGSLFMSTGDASSFTVVDSSALRSQNIDSLAGKILRINTSGEGFNTNPFWNGDADANRSKVWAYGLRNPYRMNLKPGTLLPFYGDVGWNEREEVGVAPPGANLGWPCYEGDNIQSGYQAQFSQCQSLINQGPSAVKAPLVAWAHNAYNGSTSSAATGGAFYTGTAYPAQYQGAYFYADYGKAFIRYLKVDANNNLVPGSDTFFAPANSANNVVALQMGPDQNLYYLAINTQQVRRIRYVSASNTPPIAVADATPTTGLAPLTVQLSSAGSVDPDGDVLSYTWSFGDGTPVSTQTSPSHTYATNGTYTATLTVDDGRGGTKSDSVTIVVGNQAPVVTVSVPAAQQVYHVGEQITFTASVNDPDPGDTIASTNWAIIIQHCPFGNCHEHTHSTGSGTSGQFTAPDHGDGSHFEIRVIAMDNRGLSGTGTAEVQPQTVQVTLTTSPAGLQVIYDGTSVAAPLTRTSVVGSKHTINAPSPQGWATFQSWSDGGAASHDVTLGAANVTYTATFQQPTIVTFDDKSGQDQALTGQYPTNVINWGSSPIWYHSGSWGQFTTKSASFNGGGITSATFTFMIQKRLLGFDVFNGGGGSTTVTASCSGQPTKSVQVGSNQVTTVTTGWANKCTTVTLSSSNGWDTNFDNLAFDDGGGAPPPDTTDPVISAVQATGITNTAATITWTTDEASDSLVEYGPTTAYGSSTPLNTAMVTAHSVALSGLTPGTPYNYRVKSKDAAGNEAISNNFTFTTTGGTDSTPPTISAVQSGLVTSSGATITWTTNENATSNVEYGPTTSYGSIAPSPADTNADRTSHSVALTGLAANTTYNYRVKSKDAAGNEQVSGNFTFTTSAASSGGTVTFNDKSGQDQALNGQYPAGVIDWGTNQWYHSGPWGQFTTKSASFNGGTVTSRTFNFVGARKLVSIKAYNGGNGATTITLSCAGQTTKTQSVPAGGVATISTGWTGTCTTVTVGSSNGWDTNFDDLVYQ